jgi:hypothetical protein
MRISCLSPVLLLAAVATTGCASYMAPYGLGPARPYPSAYNRPLPPPVDPSLMARGRWDNVMRLPAGAVVDVLTKDGLAYVGNLSGADGYRIRVLSNGIEEGIARADVMRVDLVDLPGSEFGAVAKRTVGGAALGVGAAALIGAVVGGPLWPPPAAMLRGGAALGGTAGASAAIAARAGRLVYLAEDQRAEDQQRPRHLRPERTYSAADWALVMDLAPGSEVAVLATNGIRYNGKLIAVETDAIRIDMAGAEVRVPRASVVSVDVFPPRPWMTRERAMRLLGDGAIATSGASTMMLLASSPVPLWTVPFAFVGFVSSMPVPQPRPMLPAQLQSIQGAPNREFSYGRKRPFLPICHAHAVPMRRR